MHRRQTSSALIQKRIQKKIQRLKERRVSEDIYQNVLGQARWQLDITDGDFQDFRKISTIRYATLLKIPNMIDTKEKEIQRDTKAIIKKVYSPFTDLTHVLVIRKHKK